MIIKWLRKIRILLGWRQASMVALGKRRNSWTNVDENARRLQRVHDYYDKLRSRKRQGIPRNYAVLCRQARE